MDSGNCKAFSTSNDIIKKFVTFSFLCHVSVGTVFRERGYVQYELVFCELYRFF